MKFPIHVTDDKVNIHFYEIFPNSNVCTDIETNFSQENEVKAVQVETLPFKIKPQLDCHTIFVHHVIAP